METSTSYLKAEGDLRLPETFDKEIKKGKERMKILEKLGKEKKRRKNSGWWKKITKRKK